MACCGVIFIPQFASANEAFWVTENTALFTIDFNFNAKNNQFLIPIGAAEGLTTKSGEDFAGYSIESNLKVTQTNAVILSDQTVEGIYYKVNPKTTGRFTMLVLVEFEEVIADTEIVINTTSLPHYYDERRSNYPKETLGQLNSLPLIKK